MDRLNENTAESVPAAAAVASASAGAAARPDEVDGVEPAPSAATAAAPVVEPARAVITDQAMEDVGPSIEDPETAFDYFNHPEWFFPILRSDSDDVAKRQAHADATYMYERFCRDSNKATLQKWTLDQFFAEAQRHDSSHTGLNTFFDSFELVKKALNQAITGYHEWQTKTVDIQRVVPVDYKISSQPLFHSYDLNRLKAAIEDVFDWYTDKPPSQKKVGPYLCFVQSSGMGKTKLMYEFREDSFHEESEVAACLILPLDKDTPNRDTVTLHQDTKVVFDFRIDFQKAIRHCADEKKAAQVIYSRLDKVLNDTLETNLETRRSNQRKNRVSKNVPIQECSKVVLMFDESQLLVNNKFENFEFDAFLFRCVRVWLREKRGGRKVVAIFAGTNWKITNFFVRADDELLPGEKSSRDVENGVYYEKGSNQLYPPFHHTATIGSCRREPVTGATEYERATNYGRPLFAVMAQDGTLHQNIPTVLCRMLLVSQKKRGDDWTSDLNAWKAVANFLGTRVQLGDTSFDMGSSLVAKAYANLAECSEACKSLKLAYLPDPVCARLAMCMMDEDFEHAPALEWTKRIKGMKKTWWAGKIRELFSTGMVRPAKGDFGEVAVALYMLFCGDLLRKTISDTAKSKNRDSLDYSHFSVSIDAWLDLLSSGGKPLEETKLPANQSEDNPSVSVGFIQVCRNYLRSYGTSWASLKNQTFLSHIYKLGVAFYVFEGCDYIDMVAPLRIIVNCETASPKYEFVPMLVSITSMWACQQRHAMTACKNMKEFAESSGLTRALCLLISFGSNPNSEPFSSDITIAPGSGSVSKLLQEDNIVTRAIRIPDDDVFGLTKAFLDMTPESQVNSDLFSSHSFLMAYRDAKYDELNARGAVCARSNAASRSKYDSLRDAMGSPALQPRVQRADDDNVAGQE